MTMATDRIVERVLLVEAEREHPKCSLLGDERNRGKRCSFSLDRLELGEALLALRDRAHEHGETGAHDLSGRKRGVEGDRQVGVAQTAKVEALHEFDG